MENTVIYNQNLQTIGVLTTILFIRLGINPGDNVEFTQSITDLIVADIYDWYKSKGRAFDFYKDSVERDAVNHAVAMTELMLSLTALGKL